MPIRPPKICAWPSCGRTTTARYCEAHAQAALHTQRKESDQRRGSSSARLYTYAWQKYAQSFLRKNPLCKHCAHNGRVTPATVVDHIIPHRGDIKLFWDKSNHQGLCTTCHSSHKQRYEKSGRVLGCHPDGTPFCIDPAG